MNIGLSRYGVLSVPGFASEQTNPLCGLLLSGGLFGFSLRFQFFSLAPVLNISYSFTLIHHHQYRLDQPFLPLKGSGFSFSPIARPAASRLDRPPG